MSTAIVKKIPPMPGSISISDEWVAERERLLEESNGLVVETATQYDVCCRQLAEVTTHRNKLEKVRKSITDPFLQAQKLIKATADEAGQSLDDRKEELNKKGSKFIEESKRKQREAEAEAQRKAQEAALAAIEEEEAQRKIFGDDEDFDEQVAPEAPPPVETAPISSFASSTERVVVESIDEDKLDRLFMSPDTVKVNGFIAQHKDKIKKALLDKTGEVFIEGVVFKIETTIKKR